MTTMRLVRGVTAATGFVLIAVGTWHLFASLHHLRQWVGLAEWSIAAVIVHDGVLVPLMELVSHAWRRMGAGLTRLGRSAVSVGFLIGVFLTGAAIPALVAQRKGARNPTVVPQHYVAHLLGIWLAIAVVVAALAWLSRWRGSRSGVRRRSSR